MSDEASVLLATIPPTDLVVQDRLRIRAAQALKCFLEIHPPSKDAIKREERRKTVAQWQLNWQTRWSSTTNVSWTWLAIPDISRRFYRVTWPRHWRATIASRITYYNRQGHGHHLYKSDLDTVNHTLFEC